MVMKSLFPFPLYTREYLLVFTSLHKVNFSLFYKPFWTDLIFNRIYNVFTSFLLLLFNMYWYVLLNTWEKHLGLYHFNEKTNVETHRETS